MYTKEDLIKHIQKLRIKPNDTVMVHTSLKSVGEIDSEGKTTAEVLIDALRECLCDGLLLIPAHTWATVPKESQIFDVMTSKPCVGAVPCAAVKLANEAREEGKTGIVRSLHPTHSVVAFGKDAEEYIQDDVFASTPAPWNGSFGKLSERGGKILLIGVEQNRNTYIHAVDEWLDLPDKLVEAIYDVQVRDYDGNLSDRRIQPHVGNGHFFFPYYEPYLDRNGAMTYGYIGDAFCRVCDAKICAETVRDTLSGNLKEKYRLFFEKA